MVNIREIRVMRVIGEGAQINKIFGNANVVVLKFHPGYP